MAVEKFGTMHHPFCCKAQYDWECDCGLDALRATAELSHQAGNGALAEKCKALETQVDRLTILYESALTEAKQAREFIATIVIGYGGEVTIPDDARMEVGPGTILEVTNDHENRVTRLRAK